MYKKRLGLISVTVALCSASIFGVTSAHAEDLRVQLEGFENNASGVASIDSNGSGPDGLSVKVEGLDAGERYTVFMAHDRIIGALPVQFLGEFKTQEDGSGEFTALTEVVNAFAIVNQGMEDEQGVAGEFAGAIGNGATTLALNHIRIYDGDDELTRFGPSESSSGGLLVLATEEPLR